MQLLNSPQRYGVPVQFMHWATVVFVIGAWLLGIFDDELPRGAARDTGRFIHMSLGLLVLALLVLRLSWRVVDQPPPPEKTALGPRLERIGRLTHGLLYLLLSVIPAVGIAAQFARGRALPLFGMGQIVSPWSANRAFSHSVTEVHEWVAHALLAIAALHAAAAIAHHYLLRDRTLSRMLPGT